MCFFLRDFSKTCLILLWKTSNLSDICYHTLEPSVPHDRRRTMQVAAKNRGPDPSLRTGRPYGRHNNNHEQVREVLRAQDGAGAVRAARTEPAGKRRPAAEARGRPRGVARHLQPAQRPAA